MRHQRIRTSIPVEFCLAGRVVEGTVRNASDGGMFVETRTIPMQGEPVSVVVRLAEIDHDEMEELVLEAWRMVVPKKVAAERLGD